MLLNIKKYNYLTPTLHSLSLYQGHVTVNTKQSVGGPLPVHLDRLLTNDEFVYIRYIYPEAFDTIVISYSTGRFTGF